MFSHANPPLTLAARLHRRFIASLGVQGLLLDAGRQVLSAAAQRLAHELTVVPEGDPAPRKDAGPRSSRANPMGGAAPASAPPSPASSPASPASSSAMSGASVSAAPVGVAVEAALTEGASPQGGVVNGSVTSPPTLILISNNSGSAATAAVTGEAPIPTLPHTEEGIRALIETLSQSISALDDVKDYDLIRAIDDNMYNLWKELERKMQRHRQSEARFQLKDMFRI